MQSRAAEMSEADRVTRTGVIGLGAMGLQMARHMAAKGFDVAGYDVRAEANARAKEHGVKICGSVAGGGDHAGGGSGVGGTGAPGRGGGREARLVGARGGGGACCLAVRA